MIIQLWLRLLYWFGRVEVVQILLEYNGNIASLPARMDLD